MEYAILMFLCLVEYPFILLKPCLLNPYGEVSIRMKIMVPRRIDTYIYIYTHKLECHNVLECPPLGINTEGSRLNKIIIAPPVA